jgi:D-alanyl-D-alanine carboxypeptidase/D-alanyl-D-alanine-endopeptidase (penicillin-binding protein 4)
VAAALLALSPASAVASPESGLKRSLSRVMSVSWAASGAYVVDAQTGRRLFSWSAGTPRILASNTKLFTSGAALARHGPGATVPTRVLVGGPLDLKGTAEGDVYLRGGGDPAFGSAKYVRNAYGADGRATVEALAHQLHDKGLRLVRGSIVGDESLFDSLRGGPTGGFAPDSEVTGPLTALVYNHGLMTNGRFQRNPPAYAAARLTDALRKLGVKVRRPATAGRAPDDAIELARVESQPMSKLAQLTAVPSDNYFAETLAKGLGGGTTTGGARSIVRFARSRGARIRLADGSGLSRADRAAPREVVDFLVRERSGDEYRAFYAALPIAGVNGTLYDRMRSGPAHHRCRAKTGTLIGVSALSGYCRSRGGHQIAFSILMNGVTNIYRAHYLQDKMAQAIAAYAG